MPIAESAPQLDVKDLPAFWKSANTKLIRYGGAWSNVVITRAKGTVMWVSDLQSIGLKAHSSRISMARGF
jgi:hypothetical protein